MKNRKVRTSATVDHECSFCTGQIAYRSIAVYARVAGERVYYHPSCYDVVLRRIEMKKAGHEKSQHGT